jgi:hypothetical protein
VSYEDPIVQEVRQIREEHAARFNYDFQAIVADLKQSEAARDPAKSPLLAQPEVSVVLPDSAVQRARFARR